MITFSVIRSGDKYYITDQNGNKTSSAYDYIDDIDSGLFHNRSSYYIAGNDEKVAIFDINGKQISDWFKQIYPHGLVHGTSRYYVVVKHNNKMAIYDIDGNQVSEEYDYISPIGLVSGESNFYLAVSNKLKAIFNLNKDQVTNWFEDITAHSLLTGQSHFFIATYSNDLKQIFDITGNIISNKHKLIYPVGLINGKNSFYVTYDLKSEVSVYHKDFPDTPIYTIVNNDKKDVVANLVDQLHASTSMQNLRDELLELTISMIDEKNLSLSSTIRRR